MCLDHGLSRWKDGSSSGRSLPRLQKDSDATRCKCDVADSPRRSMTECRKADPRTSSSAASETQYGLVSDVKGHDSNLNME
jgi:hypothetical protein